MIRRRLWHFLTFAGPGVLIYVCFVLAPILISFGYSLTNYNPFNPPTEYVGLGNYRLLFGDSEFLTALRVTTILTLIVVIVPNALGLAVAVLLDRRGWLYNVTIGDAVAIRLRNGKQVCIGTDQPNELEEAIRRFASAK